MNLYLVRHGKAHKGGRDVLRPLMRRGIRETKALADFLKKMGIRPAVIWHSERVRAIETAQVLKKLRPRRGLIQKAGMGPDDPVGPMLKLIEREKSDVMIVGHLPHLGKLLAKLVDAGDADEILHFPPSTAVIVSDATGRWSIEAVIPPSVSSI